MRAGVIGVGTRQGDDAAGLAVAERLAAEPLPAGVRVELCERPPDLLDVLGGLDAVVIVDAVRTGGAPGTVSRLRPVDVGRGPGFSSHALGVGDALRLAEALGRSPAHVELVGIEASLAPEDGLSPGARSGVERAAVLVREILGELARSA